MPIEFRCDHCRKLLRVPDGTAGQQAKCPECGALLPIPESATPSPPPESAPGQASPPPPGGQRALPDTGPYPQPDAENPYAAPAASAYDYAAPGRGVPAGQITPTRIDIGDVFARTWAIFKQQWANVLLAAVVAILISAVVNVPVSLVCRIAGEVARNLVLFLVFNQLGTLIGMLFNSWLEAGLVVFTLKAVRGENAEVADLFRGGPYYLAVLGVNIVIYFAVMVGFLLCIVPGVILALMFSQAVYLIVDRKAGAMESLELSARITRGNKLTLFALYLLCTVGGAVLVVLTCGLGIFVVVPLFMLLQAVTYLAITGQPTVDQQYDPRYGQQSNVPPPDSTQW